MCAQMFHPPPRPTVWTLRREKGVPLGVSVPLFPPDTGQDLNFNLERHQLPSGSMCFWAGGQLLKKSDGGFTQQLLSPKEKVQALQMWEGLSAACPTPHLHQQQTGRLFSNTELSCENKQTPLSYVVKKRSSISCSSPQAFFVWGVGVSGF